MKRIATLLAVAMIAAVGVMTSASAHAAVGLINPSDLAGIMPLAGIAAGGVARLVAGMSYSRFAPRIAFDKPNDGGVDLEALAKDVTAQFQKSFDEVKAIAEKAVAEAKKGVDMTTAEKQKADEALIKMNGLTEQVKTLEQKLLEGKGGREEQRKSMGEMFVEDAKVKEFLAHPNPRGRIDLSAKATLTSLTTDAAGSVGDAIANTRLPGILPLPQRRMTVRDLLSQGQMDGSTLEYVKETGFTNSAGMVAEGGAKPQSDIKLELYSTSAKVIMFTNAVT